MLWVLLKAVGVPVLIAVGGVLITWLITSWTESKSASGIGGSIVFVSAFFAGFSLINGAIPPFPPSSTINWIPYCGGAAGVIGIVQIIWSGPWWVRWGLRLLLVRGSFWLTLQPILSHQLSGPDAALWAWGWDLSVLGIWWGIERLHERGPPAVPPVLFLIPGTAASLLLIGVMDYASMALAFGSFAAVLGVMTVAGAIKPDTDLARGVLPVAALLLPLMLVNGSMFASGATAGGWGYLLLAFVPLGGWGIAVAGDSSGPEWRRIVAGPAVTFLLAMLLSGLSFYPLSSGAEDGAGNTPQTEKETGGESGEPYGEDYGYD